MATFTNFVLFDLNILGVSYLLLDSQESNVVGTITLTSYDNGKSYSLAYTDYCNESERANLIKEALLLIHNDIKF